MGFVAGLESGEALFQEAVAPLLAHHAPELPFAAGLIGPGSEVPGFDTDRSTDHDWGPRLQIYLASADLPTWQPVLLDIFRTELPQAVAGYSTASRDLHWKRDPPTCPDRPKAAPSTIG